MKKATKFNAFIAVVLAVSLIGQLRLFDEYLRPGSELTAYINIKNPFSHKLEDVEVSISSYELGILSERSPFDLPSKETASKIIDTRLPNAIPKGDYIIKVSARTKDRHSYKYRYLTIV